MTKIDIAVFIIEEVMGYVLYISNNFCYKLVFPSTQYGLCESLFTEFIGSGTSVVVDVVYLPTCYVDSFEDSHSDLFGRYSNIIVMGNFNYNLFDPLQSLNFRSLLVRWGLNHVPNCLPTHLHLPNNGVPSLFSTSFIYISFQLSPLIRQYSTEYKDYDRLNTDYFMEHFNLINYSTI